MEKGKCKLCLSEDVYLLTKSHIIPRFLFEDMKDEFNSIHEITPSKYVKGRNQHIKRPKDAFYESNILCQNCDGRTLKKYEDYIKLMFHKTKKPVDRPMPIKTWIIRDGAKAHKIKNIDYKMYKLGFLSILWRASISSLKVFKQVNLGEKHSEIIREMLLTGKPKDIHHYPFLLALFSRSAKNSSGIASPELVKMNKYHNYRFIINGIDVFFMVGSSDVKVPNSLLECVPNDKNEAIIFEHNRAYSTNYAFRQLISWHKQHKF